MKNEINKEKGKKLLRYSMQLSMLQQLFSLRKITKWEYERIKTSLQKDYGVVSDISSCVFTENDV